MKKNNFIISCFVCCMMLFSVQSIFAQGGIGEYPGAGVGFDSGCGYPDAGNSDPGVSDTNLAGNTCGSPFNATFGAWTETAAGFDITGFELNNFDIDQEAAYGIRLFYGPQNNCCTICLDAMLDLGQGAACGTFGPQTDLGTSFGYPVPASYGQDIFGAPEGVIPYADMCPNTEYFAQYQLISATAVDLTDPDGNFCAMDDALITNAGTQTTVQTLVAPGTRDPIVINATTLTAAAAADCGSANVLVDFTADITAGCTVSFGTCSQGLEFEFRAALACADGTTLDITTGPLVNDPTGCYTGAVLTGQISLGTAADVCAIYACDPNAMLELYTTYTFCEADDIVGDGSGNDEAVAMVSIASILADYDAAMCCNVVAACPEFNAQTYGPICNGYDICIGYIDTDQDGIGDAGEDPTGVTMTVADGIATSTAQAPINDGIFFFDADGDGVSDAVGYCYTVLFDNPTCDPEPYTPLVTVTCADGTPGMLLGGTPLTDFDILAGTFGIPGGTAIYPPLVGIVTAPVCPMLPDGSDAVAGNVEVFVADAAGNPTATSCLVVPGPVPACDSDNTADPAANAIPVQFNPTNDPLFTALAGPDSYSCGLNAVADLSIACPACDVMAACPEFNAQTYGPICNGYDICIGYIDTDQDGIGDAGEDPTGVTMTVADGIATSTAQAPINDGIFFFDADGDGVSDAVGYCYTVLFDNPTCDPEPYTPLVTVTCADGTPGMLLGGTPLTDFDILAGTFGIPGGTAIYPPLVGIVTAPVCPILPDGSDAVAGNVEVFVADAAGNPTATSCLVVPGPVPACDSDNTADPAANAIPVQFNPTNDPLFTALAGPDSYSCGLNAVADLSIACAACGVACETYNAITVAAGCNVFDICIGYTDASGFDPTGTTMTVDFGGATGGTLINDGIFAFDADGDGVADAAGYCVTYEYDEQGCDPVPYSGLVTLMCPDGTAGVLDVGTGAITLTAADVVGGVFGVAGGGAFYPVLTAATTAAVCPTLEDNSDGVAASVVVTSPDGTVCTTITGEAPLCATAGGNAAEPVQLNPVADPLLTALFGADPAFPYVCTIDETADLSYDCPTCVVPPTCAISGDLGTAPAPPTVTESTCQADGTTVDGGVIDPITCPAGATAEYSVDGGATWTTTVPAYMQTTAMTVTVRCLCDEDGTTASPTSDVTTVPGMCTPPACAIEGDLAAGPTAPGVTESTCDTPGGTPSGGMIDYTPTTCPAGSMMQFSTDGGATWVPGPGPSYDQSNPITFSIRCLCDEDGMTASPATTVTTNPGTCPPPPVCNISVTISNFACDDGGTPEDPSDDTVTFDYEVQDIGGTGTTWSSDQGDAGAAYSTAGSNVISVGPVPATNASWTINVNDDGDTACTDSASVNLSSCETVENIPTVGEWGLIILGLLMSITAIVGIRQRREEEATA